MRSVRGIVQRATGSLVAGMLVASTVAVSTGFAGSYSEARDSFDSTLSLEQRITAQVLLDAAGYAPVVPMSHLSPQAYEAIRSFEDANGYAASGLLTQVQMRRLAMEAAAYLRDVGFRRVAYPGRALSIWVPLGLGLDGTRDDGGLHFRDKKGRLAIDMVSLDASSVQDAHARRIAEEKAQSAIIRDDNYSAGDRWFAISSRRASGDDRYYRVYQDGSRVTGFALEWRNGAEGIDAEGIAAIMSGSLRSAILDEPFVDPPVVALVQAPVTSEP